jgi:hypothetical protein
MKEIIKDKTGKQSSKRLVGGTMLSIGIVMGVALFVVSILGITDKADLAIQTMYAFLGAGGGLLGIGTFEKLK